MLCVTILEGAYNIWRCLSGGVRWGLRYSWLLYSHGNVKLGMSLCLSAGLGKPGQGKGRSQMTGGNLLMTVPARFFEVQDETYQMGTHDQKSGRDIVGKQ